MKVDAPCKNCNSRILGCHSHCDKYIEYKEKIIYNSRIIIKNNIAENYQKSVVINKIMKNAKRNLKK